MPGGHSTQLATFPAPHLSVVKTELSFSFEMDEACQPIINLLCTIVPGVRGGVGFFKKKKILHSFHRITSWEEIAPVEFSTSSRGNLGKKRSPLHLPKNTRRREGVDLVDPRNQSPLQCPKGTSACPPASHCQWRPRRSGQWGQWACFPPVWLSQPPPPTLQLSLTELLVLAECSALSLMSVLIMARKIDAEIEIVTVYSQGFLF